MSWLSKQNEKKRMKKLVDEMPTYRYTPKGAYIDRKGVYRRVNFNNRRLTTRQFFRKLANRLSRRRLGNEERVGRGEHKKIFDLKWTLD